MFDDLFWERVKARQARARARPRWQKLLIGATPAVLVAACLVVVRVGDGDGESSKPVAAVRSACLYVDQGLVATLFGTPEASLTEALASRQAGVTRYTCLIKSLPALSLQVDLDVYTGTFGPDNPLPAMAVSGQTSYEVHDVDGVLVAAKRADKNLYAVTLTASTNRTPAPEDKLKSLAASIIHNTNI